MKKLAFLLALASQTAVFAQNLPASYDFGLGITYEMKSGKEGQVKAGEKIGVWFAKGDYTGIESARQKGFFMVMDLQQQKMVTFMKDQKMAMVMDLNKLKDKMKGQVPDENQPAPSIKKTGKTATILGYSCQEYLAETEQHKTLVWITTQLGDGMGNFAKTLATVLQTGPGKLQMPSLKGIENGVILKVLSTDKKSGNISGMEAVEVKKEALKQPTTGYNVMAMPGM